MFGERTPPGQAGFKDRELSGPAADGAGDQGFCFLMAGGVHREPGLEAVGSVQDHVVVAHQGAGVGVVQHLGMGLDRYMRVQRR